MNHLVISVAPVKRCLRALKLGEAPAAPQSQVLEWKMYMAAAPYCCSHAINIMPFQITIIPSKHKNMQCFPFSGVLIN